MSLSSLFAYSLRLAIIESHTKPPTTQIVSNRRMSGSLFPAALRLDPPRGLPSFAGLSSPADRRHDLDVVIEPEESRSIVVYAARPDLHQLSLLAAGWLGKQPHPMAAGYGRPLVLVTPRALAERSNPDINQNGIPCAYELDGTPVLDDLFGDATFWSRLRSLKMSRGGRAEAKALAAFVHEHGYRRLAKLLRSDQHAALRVMPCLTDCRYTDALRVSSPV